MEIGPLLRAMLRNKTRVVLLVLEIAVTVAIVLNCLNLLLDQRQRLQRDSGIDEENLIAVSVDAWGDAYGEREFRDALVDRDLEHLRALPGVVDATITSNFPLQGGGSSFQVKQLGAPDTDLVRAPYYVVDAHVLGALDLEIVAGRGFEPEDLPTEPGPQIMSMLVTKDLADALFPDGDAVGQTIDTGSEEYPDRIVGVVDHMWTPYGGGPMESRIAFYPGRSAGAAGMQYLVRTEPGALDGVFGEIEGVLTRLQAERVVDVRTLLEVKGGGQFVELFLIRILGSIIALLLFVTALGIFGMTSFSVAQRTKQVGTRRALGATRSAIVRFFLLENLLLATIGTGLGLIGAFLLSGGITTHMDATPLGPELVGGGVGLLFAISVLATIVPAVQASRVPPAFATRTV